MKEKTVLLILLCCIWVLILGCSKIETIGDSTNSTDLTDKPSAATVEQESETTMSEEIIKIQDPVLEQMIRDQIGKPNGDLTNLDMEMVSSISINYEKEPVNDISGLEYAVNLHDFSFSRGTLKSLDPIAKLQSLFYMSISYAEITEPTAEFDTPALERISFIDTNVSDFGFLKNVTAANDVSFSSCNITNIDFMQSWSTLTDVYLTDNLISDIEPLRDKIGIISLNIHQNNVVSIDALSTLTNLESLNISYNHVADISPIMNLMKLTELTAYEELDQKIIDRGLLESLRTRGVTVDYHE
ncbi:leucine-rich repeat domain-containing protein [Fusibacter bizertensis]